MAKNTTRPKGGADQKKQENKIKNLSQQITALNRKFRTRDDSGKERRARVRKALPDVENLGTFARAFLDPFGVRGARVPDSSLVKTAVSWSHYWTGATNGVPSFNFTNNTCYVQVIGAPLWANSSNPLRAYITPDATQSFYDFSGNASPLTFDYTKHFGVGSGAENHGPLTTTGCKAHRVSGGGIRIRLTDVNPNNPVDVYAVPMFNNDTLSSTFGEILVQRVRHWRVSEGSEDLIIPLPVRSINNAFPWVNAGKNGAVAADYPTDDAVTSNNLFAALIATPSTNVTSTNTQVSAWSLQSGLGGWQICFNLPPGVGWTADLMLHAECLLTGTTPSYYAASDADTKVSLADRQQLETVSNLVAMTCNKEETVYGGTVSPWYELASEMGSQALDGLTSMLKDSQLVNRMAKAGGSVAASYLTGGASRMLLTN